LFVNINLFITGITILAVSELFIKELILFVAVYLLSITNKYKKLFTIDKNII